MPGISEKRSPYIAGFTPAQRYKLCEIMIEEVIRPKLLTLCEKPNLEQIENLWNETILILFKQFIEQKFYPMQLHPRLLWKFLVEMKHMKETIELEIRTCRENYRGYVRDAPATTTTDDEQERSRSLREKYALRKIREDLSKTTLLKEVVEWAQKFESSDGFSLEQLLESRASTDYAIRYIAMRFGRSAEEIRNLLECGEKLVAALVLHSAKPVPLRQLGIKHGTRQYSIIGRALKSWKNWRESRNVSGLTPTDRRRVLWGYFGCTTLGMTGVSHFDKTTAVVSLKDEATR